MKKNDERFFQKIMAYTPADHEHQVTQSKRGWHPCDYQTFVKVKSLLGLCFLDRRLIAKWERWYAKDPKNRVRKLPWFEKTPAGVNTVQHKDKLVPVPEPMILDLGMSEDRLRRMMDLMSPKATETEARTVQLTYSVKTIDEWITQAQAWVPKYLESLEVVHV